MRARLSTQLPNDAYRNDIDMLGCVTSERSRCTVRKRTACVRNEKKKPTEKQQNENTCARIYIEFSPALQMSQMEKKKMHVDTNTKLHLID